MSVALIAAACGGSSKGGSATATTASSSSVKKGGTVTMAIDETIPGWNINTSADNEFVLQEILNYVWPSVFIAQPNLSMKLNTDLVTSATVTNQSPQTIVYKINPKAVWSDGTPITASDFIYNWQAQSGLPQYKDINGQPFDDVSTTGYANIQSVTGSPDGKTVTVTFQKNAPFGDWKSLFGNLVPAHVAQKVGWNTGFNDWHNVISGGPFVISNYVKDQTVTLTQNPKWWGTKANLDSVVFRILGDDTSGPPAMQNGEVQIFYPSSASKQLLDQVKQIPNTTTQTPPGLEFEHLDFNETNPYLANVKVRQAFAYALDRTQLIARTVGQLNPSIKPVGNRMFLNTQPEYVNNGAAYDHADVAKAKSLLESAGMKMGPDGYFQPATGPLAGKDLSFNLSTTTGQQLRSDTEQVIQSMEKAAGIKINIVNYSASQLFGTNLPKGQYDIAEFAWVDTPFPSGNLSIYCSYTNAQTCGQNWIHYSNPQVDKLLTQAVATVNKSQADSLYNQADKLLWQDMATLPLFQRPIINTWTNTLTNIVPNTSSVGLTWNMPQWGFKAS